MIQRGSGSLRFEAHVWWRKSRRPGREIVRRVQSFTRSVCISIHSHGVGVGMYRRTWTSWVWLAVRRPCAIFAAMAYLGVLRVKFSSHTSGLCQLSKCSARQSTICPSKLGGMVWLACWPRGRAMGESWRCGYRLWCLHISHVIEVPYRRGVSRSLVF